MTARLRRWTGVSLHWSQRDAYPWLGPLAALGLAAGVALALLGLPPISLHGPLHFAGIMDPACGMTRGVVAVLRGDLEAAVTFNPASPLVPALGVAALARWGYGLRTDRWLVARFSPRPLTVSLVAAAAVALAVNQQMHADLLAG